MHQHWDPIVTKLEDYAMHPHWDPLVTKLENWPGNLDTWLSWPRRLNVGFDIMADLDCHASQYLMEEGTRNKAHQVLARCLTQHQRQLYGSREAVCSGGTHTCFNTVLSLS